MCIYVCVHACTHTHTQTRVITKFSLKIDANKYFSPEKAKCNVMGVKRISFPCVIERTQ